MSDGTSLFQWMLSPATYRRITQSTIDHELIEYSQNIITMSGVVDLVQQWVDEDNYKKHPGGRPALVEMNACLVLLLVLAIQDRKLLFTELRDLAHLGLSVESRAYLGLPEAASGRGETRDMKNWYNNVRNAFHRVVTVMDGFPAPRRQLLSSEEREQVLSARDLSDTRRRKERLDTFSSRLITTIHEMQPDWVKARQPVLDVTVDQTPVLVHSKRGISKLKNGKETRNTHTLETDARWYAKNSDDRDSADTITKRTTFVWGFAANIVTRAPHSPAESGDYPLLAYGLTLSPPGKNLAQETVQLLEKIATDYNPGRITADRAYFAQLRQDTFHVPIRQQGWGVITDYKDQQLGAYGGKAGAKHVEGDFYCPAMPEPLTNATIDLRQGIFDDDEYAKRIDARQAYVLRNKERPDAHGRVPKMCPAAGKGATVACSLKPNPHARNKPKPEILDRNQPEVPDRICTQHSVVFEPEDGIRQAQDLRYGSTTWRRTYTTNRNTIEGFNALVKDPAHSDLGQPGRRRVRGISGQQVLITFLTVASNIRILMSFLEKYPDELVAKRPRPGQRRREREELSNYAAPWTLEQRKRRAAKPEPPPPE